MIEREKGVVSQGVAAQPKKKIIAIVTSQAVVDHLKNVAALYDEEFIAGPTKHKTIIEKFCKLFTPEEMLEIMKKQMQAKRK